MNKFLLMIGFFLMAANCRGQVDSLKTMSLDMEVAVRNIEAVKQELDLFFAKHGVVPDSYQESNSRFTSQFTLSEELYFECRNMVNAWGAILSRKMESVNYTEKLQAIEREISQLEKDQQEYQYWLEQVEVNSASHVKYWEKLEESKSSLRKARKQRDDYLNSNKKFKIKLKVKEENHLANEPDFSFVNMPGIQYSFFVPTNPDGTRFPQSMSGYSLKYLMNRRKTYLELGLFKSNSNTEEFDQLYKFGLGQDFYSSHLGRGTRKFFNLYSGFSLGVFILTGNESTVVSWYATPSIGVEIYKSRNILWDTKAGYFLPFAENRNMSGMLWETSFNVVF